MRFLDVNYHFYPQESLKEIVDRYYTNFGFLFYLSKKIEITSLLQAQFDDALHDANVTIIAQKGRPLRKIDLPLKMHKKVKQLQPDVILIHGLRYGLYAYFIRKKLRNNPIIILQVHGYAEAPSGLKKIMYKWINKYVDGYVFTGLKNAESWTQNSIFDRNKVFSIMEGSVKKQKKPNKKIPNSFLWVARLHPKKDPLTILHAFEKFLHHEPTATLHMVYNSFGLLNQVEKKVSDSKLLSKAVTLIGELRKEEIEPLYKKFQFFIIGSYSEGSGYALLEAMAYGCIPVVTKIPSHEFMTRNGSCGFLFRPGSIDDLLKQLLRIKDQNLDGLTAKVYQHFDEKLSFKAIANDFQGVFDELSKRRS